MTIFNTNPAAGGSGGDYDYLNDAEVGTVALLPKSIAEAHPKWESNLNGQTVPFGFWTDIDPIVDFHIPEITQELRQVGFPRIVDTEFNAKVLPISSDNTTATFRSYEFNTTLDIFEIVYDKITNNSVKTFVKTIPNLTNPIQCLAQNGDSWIIGCFVSNSEISLHHYNNLTNTTTSLNASIAGTMESIVIFHYNENIGKFVLQYKDGTTLYTYTSILGNSGWVQENTETITVATDLKTFEGMVDINGFTNYNKNTGTYFINKQGDMFTEFWKVFENDLTSNNTVFDNGLSWIPFEPNVTTSIQCSEDTVMFMRDWENFGMPTCILAVSKDNGLTFDDYRMEIGNSSNVIPDQLYLQSNDYVLVVQERSLTYNSTSSLLSQGSLDTEDFIIDASASVRNFDKTPNAKSIITFTNIDNNTVISVSDKDMYKHTRFYRAGEGVTLPIAPENGLQPQMSYALKHTT